MWRAQSVLVLAAAMVLAPTARSTGTSAAFKSVDELDANEKPNSCLAAVYEACSSGPMGMASPSACMGCAGQHQSSLRAAGCNTAEIKNACSISSEQVPISGLQCDGDHAVWVLTGDGKPHPLVSFAHGYTAWNVTTWFPQLLYGLAARGYTVVATEAGLAGCGQESSDQARAMEWALNSPTLKAHIDMSAGTGVVGHSMGGGATIGSASNATAIADYDIRVAVAQHPAPCMGCNPKIPILYMTGDADTVVNPESVLASYTFAHGVEKSLVENHGNTHIDACGWSWLPRDGPLGDWCPQSGPLGRYCTGPNNEDVYVYDWLNCKLKGDTAACTRVTSCKEPGNTAVKCMHQAGAAAKSDDGVAVVGITFSRPIRCNASGPCDGTGRCDASGPYNWPLAMKSDDWLEKTAQWDSNATASGKRLGFWLVPGGANSPRSDACSPPLVNISSFTFDWSSLSANTSAAMAKCAAAGVKNLLRLDLGPHRGGRLYPTIETPFMYHHPNTTPSSTGCPPYSAHAHGDWSRGSPICCNSPNGTRCGSSSAACCNTYSPSAKAHPCSNGHGHALPPCVWDPGLRLLHNYTAVWKSWLPTLKRLHSANILHGVFLGAVAAL